VSVHKVPFAALCLPAKYSFPKSKLRFWGFAGLSTGTSWTDKW